MLLRRAHRGLTIIELMVAVAVLGVLVALVAPSLRGMVSAQRVRGINAEIVTDLRFALSEAVRRKRTVFMRFDNAAGCYVIYVESSPGGCDCTGTPGVNVCSNEIGREEIKTVKLPAADGVTLAASSGGGPILLFDRRDGAITPTAFEINVSGAARGQLRTTLNAAGRPTVCTPDGSIAGTPSC